jgi:hypothetical protein
VQTDWLKEEHVEFLKNLIPYLEQRADKRRARELLYGLTGQLTTRLAMQAGEEIMAEPESPLTSDDLAELNALLAKGILHNGLVPELSTVQVGRALKIFSELLGRASVSSIDLEDQEGLAWVFDMAADAQDGVNRGQVRRLELLVRAGLGLPHRLHSYVPINEQHPA